MRSYRAFFAGLTIVAVGAAAGPATAENVLRWASAGGAATFEPGIHTNSAADMRHHGQVYERLLDLDAPLELVPQLPKSWRLVDPLTWEFKLREGIRFQDGKPFSARGRCVQP